MTRHHSVGELVNGFKIEKDLGEGGFTVFYRAKKGGRDIFLKQYKEPTARDKWFSAYVDFEQQVKHCLQTGPVKTNTYEIVDIFEWKGSIYQALEFVPNQTDLWDFIISAQDDRPGKSKYWAKRVIFAKMLMDCIKKLHASRIIHCDLKPQNIVLIKDTTIKTGYLFRVADLDWSLIDGAPVPWADYMGFLGTPCYFSPEHIRREKPVFASDVFTCGVILYLLLCNYFPFDNDNYEKSVLTYECCEPVLLDNYPGVDNELIRRVLVACLHPDPSKRPTAEMVHNVLLGRIGEPRKPSAIRPESDDPVDHSKSKSRPVYLNSIELIGSLNSIKANIRTDIGKLTLKSLCGEDAMYAATTQYTIVPEGESWFVIPNTDATNETLLNGKKIIEKTLLQSGDQLGVGREEKGIVKAVVTVK